MPDHGIRYAVIVGVSDYEPGEQLLSIPFASHDAVRLKETLSDLCSFDTEPRQIEAMLVDAAVIAGR